MHNDVDFSATLLTLQQKKLCTDSALRDLLGSGVGTTEELLERLHVGLSDIAPFTSTAKRQLEMGLTHDISFINFASEAYPASLKNIADAPVIIYARGDFSLLKTLPGIAVIGTRKATPHGIIIAERIATYIGDHGISVISGLALGIDAAAHEGALKSDTPTVAVLAHGLEKASPRTNAKLADRILEGGGLWVSEHAYGVTAKPEYFVQRNRIQVGLSCASVIVEGEEKSGSMTQAEFCLKNRRILAAVLPEPGSITQTQHRLPLMLVNSRGAFAINNRADYSRFLDMAMLRRSELLGFHIRNA